MKADLCSVGLHNFVEKGCVFCTYGGCWIKSMLCEQYKTYFLVETSADQPHDNLVESRAAKQCVFEVDVECIKPDR